jgi:hypothetical protein
MSLALAGLAGCGGAPGAASQGAGAPVQEGGSSPEQAVEGFLTAAQEGARARAAGEFTEADRAYERMAALFGTEEGSINRSLSAQEVRSRMVFMSACLRPASFRIVSQPDPGAWTAKKTVVTADLTRDTGLSTLPFSVVLGRGDRWFIDRIDLTSFAC